MCTAICNNYNYYMGNLQLPKYFCLIHCNETSGYNSASSHFQELYWV